jgi:benzylsuccinate CoA-transferase BbsE subunit
MSAATGTALEGLRVLEIADESGVYCGKLLADMGADVVKIERPGGDATRRIPPFLDDTPGPTRSLFFLGTNTSKRSVTLDLERAEGQRLLLALAAGADIIVETLPPGRLEALGVGWTKLHRAHPALVLTSITGFGQTGPHRGYRSSDLVANAMGGTMAVIGEADDPPVKPASRQSDWMASTCAASSSLIAHRHARRTGQGQHVDISAQETTLAVSHVSGVGKWLDDGIIPKRSGTGLSASVPSGAYQCQDGLVYLMVNRPAHWKSLAVWINEETGNEEVLDPMFEGPSSIRQEYRELLDIFISDMTKHHTVQHVFHEGQRRHIAFTPVNTPASVAREPHLRERDYFVGVAHPSGRTLQYPGAPFRHALTPWRISRGAPDVGEHNDAIYGGELGLSPDALAALRADGVI